MNHSSSPFLRSVLKHATVKGRDLLLLLVMAEFSHMAHLRASHAALAKLSRISVGKVRISLETLLHTGHLSVVQKGNGRGNQTEYHIHVVPCLEKAGDIPY